MTIKSKSKSKSKRLVVLSSIVLLCAISATFVGSTQAIDIFGFFRSERDSRNEPVARDEPAIPREEPELIESSTGIIPIGRSAIERPGYYLRSDLDFLNISRYNIPGRIQDIASNFRVPSINLPSFNIQELPRIFSFGGGSNNAEAELKIERQPQQQRERRIRVEGRARVDAPETRLSVEADVRPEVRRRLDTRPAAIDVTAETSDDDDDDDTGDDDLLEDHTESLESRCNPKQDTTSFLFFSRAGTGNEYEIRLTRYSSLADENRLNFDPKKRTYFLFHGWFGCSLRTSEYQVKYKDLAISGRPNGANFFIVDWSHLAHDLAYMRSVDNMHFVAEDSFEFLKSLEQAFPGFNRNKIYLVGFSLGAHVSGQLGRLLDGQVNQITGLDPAGVQIANLHPKHKLSVDDAKYVLAIHTNIKFYGTKMNLAHHDVFVNGGLDQPRCRDKRNFAIPMCNHRSAPVYYSANTGNCVPLAHLCYNWQKFIAGQCGFCAANSTNDCIIPMAGELEDNNSRNLKLNQQKRNNKQKIAQAKDSPWTFNLKDQRYYALTSQTAPYCSYVYQVIVKFSDNFSPSYSENWSASVRFDNGEDILMKNFNKLDFKLTTFEGSISGQNVYTNLLVVEPSHLAYQEMPTKVDRFMINMSSKDKNVQVYVNFMSNLDFRIRKDNSGKPEIIWNIVKNPQIRH